MVTLEEFMNQAKGGGGAAAPVGTGSEPLPKGVQQIIDRVVPMIEQGTGKSMDKIMMGAAAAMGKGQLEAYLRDLIPGIGTDKAPLAKKDQKWLDYAKFVIVWAPFAVLGFGGAVVLVLWFARWLLGGA